LSFDVFFFLCFVLKVILAGLIRKPIVPTYKVNAGIKTFCTPESPNRFTIYLPLEAEPGMTLEVLTEFGDKCITLVPKEEAITMVEKERPKMNRIPGLGWKMKSNKMEKVVRKFTDVSLGYGLDGVTFIVNTDPPDPIETEVGSHDDAAAKVELLGAFLHDAGEVAGVLDPLVGEPGALK
jgi:hypothetical protein